MKCERVWSPGQQHMRTTAWQRHRRWTHLWDESVTVHASSCYRETISLVVKIPPAPPMISLKVVLSEECGERWAWAFFLGPPGPLASGPADELGPRTGWRLCPTELRSPCHGPATSRLGSRQEPQPHPRCGPWIPQQLEDITRSLR